MASDESISPQESPTPPEHVIERASPTPSFEPFHLPRPPGTPVREWFTFVIALTLVLAFVLIIATIVLTWTFSNIAHVSVDDVVKLLATVSGVMAGLVGAVAGYYFRGREEAARRGEG